MTGLSDLVESTDKSFFLYVPPDFPDDRLILYINNEEASIWSGVVIGEAIHVE